MRTKWLKVLAVRLMFLMSIYTLIRLVFMLGHADLYKDHTASTLAMSFLHGLRFDVAALCWINGIFLVLAWLRLPARLERGVFFALNGSFLIASINDIELFVFNGKRLSLEFFTSLGADFWRQLIQVAIYYWYLPMVGIAVAAALWWLDGAVDRRVSENRIPLRWGLPAWLVVFVVTFIGIRGGLQHKSIHVQTAFIQGHNELGHLTLNTPYHFLRTFNTPRPSKKDWFTTSELQARLQGLQTHPSYPGHKNHNIVLLILESFSLEYLEQGYTPFLKELAQKGLFYERHFANGRRSIEVLSSLLDGIPSVQEVPFSKSNAQAMPLKGLASTLERAGYRTSFFHGAARGSMGFESYALSHGIQRYYSREDYNGSAADFDGQWGIFDGPYLQFALREMDGFKPPFFSGVFTLSSHHPYAIPLSQQGRFPKGKLEIHESVGYVDAALRDFFTQAKKSAWYPNTLFVITADHTQKLVSKKFQNSLGLYRVPLIVFHPSVVWDARMSDKTTQHVDLPASMLDFVDVSQAGLPAVGESIFTPGEGRALHFLQPGWQYVRGRRVVHWSEGKEGQEFIWDPATGGLQTVPASGLLQESQLFIQYLLNGFRANKWPFALQQ